MADIIFVVSNSYMLTLKDYEREGSARWTEHDLHNRKPSAQFKGAGLEKLSFSIQLLDEMGVNPEEELKKLRQMRDTGAVSALVLNGSPVTQNYWRIDSLKESNNLYSGAGRCIMSEAQLSLTEYDDSNFKHQKSLVDLVGSIYNAGRIFF